MSLVNLLDEIREDLRTLPSVTRVYDNVPDMLSEWPAVVVAAMGARCWLETHGHSEGGAPVMCQHAIRVEIHVPRKDLPQQAQAMTAVAMEATTCLYNGFVTDKYDGTMVVTGNPQTANNATPDLEYSIGPSQWNGQDTYAWMCDFQVTTEQEVAR